MYMYLIDQRQQMAMYSKMLFIHAFPLRANTRQRCTVLTKDAQKIKRVPNSVNGTPKKAHGSPKDS